MCDTFYDTNTPTGHVIYLDGQLPIS